MSFFSGDISSGRRKVDLRGRSRSEESREQVLERTRRERELRKQHKLEQKSAITIQATWRGRRTVERHKSQVRQAWQARFGQTGDKLQAAELGHDASYLRELCFFCCVANATDVQCLASACQRLLRSRGLAGQDDRPAGPGSEAAPLDAADVALSRAVRVAGLSLQALVLHREALQAQLAAPRQAGGVAAPALAHQLVDASLQLTDPAFWLALAGARGAQAAAADVLQGLAKQGLFTGLAQIVLAADAALPAEDQVLGGSISSAGRPLPAAHALAVGLAARVLQAAPLRSTAWLPAAQLPHLLCLPDKFERVRPWWPLRAHLWRHSVRVLSALGGSAAVAAWLPRIPGVAGGRAGSAAALLGNLTQMGRAAIRDGQPVEDGERLAVAYLQLLQQLCGLAPLHWLLPPHANLSDVEDSGDEDDDQSLAEDDSSSGRVPWEGLPAPVEAGQIGQMHLLAAPDLLSPLVRMALPAASTVGPGAEGQGLGRKGSAGARALCALVEALGPLPALRQRCVISLAVSADAVARLWFSYLRDLQASGGVAWAAAPGANTNAGADPGWMLPLTVFARCYAAFLASAGDEEMYVGQRPLPLAELYAADAPRGAGLLALLRNVLWHALWAETPPSGGWPAPAAARRRALRSAVGDLMGRLYDRNGRRPFAPPEAFQADALTPERFHAEVAAVAAAEGGDVLAAGRARVSVLLRQAPFLVPFRERARVFQTVVAADRRAHHADGTLFVRNFLPVRRTHVLEDAYAQLGPLGVDLRAAIRIQYIDEYGAEEAGVDGGGLFKDFMEALVKEGFDPRVGLFAATADNKLYPNPAAIVQQPDALAKFHFLGRMLGKAMYEGILLELPLAGFFLKKLLRRGCDVNDLPSLDAELYRSLLFLRHYDGPVEDLALTFTAPDAARGNAEVELVPGGRSQAVTAANRVAYIAAMANFRLNRQIRAASDAFRAGLVAIVPEGGVAMFHEAELAALVGGAGGRGLDLADLRQHAAFAGGYHADHPIIHHLWQALEGFTPEQQAAWLRFVTACSRPPLLGFKYLEPPLCVAMAGSVLEPGAAERLPTAATCMNLLKLPPYRSAAAIRDKLLYAIGNVSGFDLS